MVISDMRMESDQAGAAVIAAARSAPYQPVVALLTAHPLADEDWQEMGADRMLVKPMHTRFLLEQIDRLMKTHASRQSGTVAASATGKKKVSGITAPTTKKAVANKKQTKKAVKVSAKKASVKKMARANSKTAAKKTTGRGAGQA
jgi:DNA-binding response OmpR family regulator